MVDRTKPGSCPRIGIGRAEQSCAWYTPQMSPCSKGDGILRRCAYVGLAGSFELTLSVGIMSADRSVSVLLSVAASTWAFIAARIANAIEEVNMKKAIAKAIILMVGTGLLGRPGWHVSNSEG